MPIRSRVRRRRGMKLKQPFAGCGNCWRRGIESGGCPMKKKSLKELLKELPSINEIIREHERDPKFKVILDRARLRVAVARAIKTAREKAGLTQAELAEGLGISQPMIGRLESLQDKRVPSLELLAKISAATKRKLVLDQSSIHM